MSIDSLKDKLPDFAKDVRLNLSNIANDDTLGEQTKYGLMLACAVATRNAEVLKAFDQECTPHLAPAARDAALAAATIMAMNNVYYRFVHLASNKAYGTLPAKLRMNIIGNPGVPKTDFELWSLAVSAINGCGMCIDSHEKVLLNADTTQDTIQTAVRFAAIIQSTAVALEAASLPVSAAS
ncbi:carboxymuconolactone decarboxylase family protein [Beijerinckia indica]|uniref:Alkyl hydroperoxide reductase AhpD n=1 Tax=Beijerinckia indica subsp. indica (strain ATCC 9039 / DSM 1715 / NCIMB 8712) TaxID=395963 RepID=AHPD_BEII9|nr:carboxymuconolactone decarboxylase family protein [Beijerinckia indica]B2IHZ4.1 RecName: Full=Alkyl hydroperoxide reductase AhpD; AltName: Full=Alkylhydroperoxidase AhpD [Beijerinckia indica subsp. indica ATCC 9039]ACB96040.1 alkylhydroperoxidase, AhpD family [Beijerinckia indica subsp. indica ATCC 9039]